MMLGASRFIVIDNEKDHLDAIIAAFGDLGVSCLGIHYEAGKKYVREHFAGLRILVLDLHLLSGAKQTDDKAAYALIAGFLEDYVNPEAGPYVIVLWTQFPEDAAKLITYLEKGIHPAVRPLTVIPLAKAPHIDFEKKAVRDADALRRELIEKVLENPQIKAILSWEADVVTAASATLTALIALVPPDKRTQKDFSRELDVVLSQLAKASVGPSHVEGDVRSAINGVLAPVLLDRLNAMTSAESEATWANAATQYKNVPELDPVASGPMNQMLHVETAVVGPSSWGAVNTLPDAWKADDKAREEFGGTIAETLSGAFGIKAEEIARCEPVLIRIGAACDYAQGKEGTVSLILGIKKPHDIKFKKKDSLWSSPTLTVGGETFDIVANYNYVSTKSLTFVETLTPLFRLREQILMELINRFSAHVARPGIVYLGKINKGS